MGPALPAPPACPPCSSRSTGTCRPAGTGGALVGMPPLAPVPRRRPLQLAVALHLLVQRRRRSRLCTRPGAAHQHEGCAHHHPDSHKQHPGPGGHRVPGAVVSADGDGAAAAADHHLAVLAAGAARKGRAAAAQQPPGCCARLLLLLQAAQRLKEGAAVGAWAGLAAGVEESVLPGWPSCGRSIGGGIDR